MRTTVAACSVALLLSGVSPAAMAQPARPVAAPTSAASPQTPQSPATTPAPQGATPAPDAATPDAGFAADGLADAAPEPRDRYEKLNRGIWGFNQLIDRIILKPVSSGYRAIIPRVARRGITRVFNNLGEPWSFVNNMLQAKPKRALLNLRRFVVNTTIGVGGLADHATKIGIRPAPEDFGQTLAVWGIKSSAYVVLPVFGPSTVRDGIGTGVAFVADPYQIAINQSDLSLWTKRGIGIVSLVNARANLTESGADSFLQSSLDPYAAARSAFWQRRTAAIANQDAGPAINANATNSSAANPTTGPVTDAAIAPDPFITDDAPAPDATPTNPVAPQGTSATDGPATQPDAAVPRP
ncbi:MlaA family lipoprotein [Sphingomonas arantia]|uniref:MlaA family lipoprotein n=1 Tax=Sphingomonas arantia TaxID=1460676 RepID=A0ABW4U2I3_9SPHN